MRLINTILDVIFPACCCLCQKRGRDLCPECLSRLPKAERPSALWIFPLYDYRHPDVRKVIHFMKYKGKKRLASIFAEPLYGKILEELSKLKIAPNFKEPTLVPIPLSGSRYRERGYNQAELLCEALAAVSKMRGGPSLYVEARILFKPTETEHQARLRGKKERLVNIRGSFACAHKERLGSRNIILVDDILTTGATLSEARRTLRQAGARKVIAFTIAH